MQQTELVQKFEIMLAELESNQLVTVLAPSKNADRREWDQIRVNVSESPGWYKKFCAVHASSRGIRRGKHDTIIRRQQVIESLNYLINSGGQSPKNHPGHRRLIEFATHFFAIR